MKKIFIFLIICLVLLVGCKKISITAEFIAVPAAMEVGQSIFTLDEKTTIAIHFASIVPFNGFELEAIAEYDENNLTLSLYKFDTSYNETLKYSPVITQTFKNYKKNTSLFLQTEEQPAGEYILTISKAAGGAGIYKALVPSSFSEGKIRHYVNSRIITDGVFNISVLFKNTDNIKFFGDLTEKQKEN